MNDDATAAENETTGAVREPGRAKAFSERLYVAWWAWPLPLLAGALLAASINRGYPDVPAWIPYTILLALAVYVLVALSRVRVRVTTGGEGTDAEPELHVGGAHLPLRFVGSVAVIDSEHKRKALGPELDPAAYVAHRGWIGPLVRVEVTDPADPTPYWLFSSRKPQRVASALGAGSAS